jgi:prepilin signal peptidase PulO-like enzyme (type II secretory pathway)
VAAAASSLSAVGNWRRTDLIAGAIACTAWTTAIARADDPAHLAAMGSAGTLLAAVAWFDFRTLRAPNLMVLPGLAVVLGTAFLFGTDALFQATAGAAVAFVLMLLIAVIGRGAMGLGDVKFAALTGAVVGLRLVLPALVVAFVIGGLVAAVFLGFRLRRRKDVVAFTPLLAAGAIAAMAFYPGYLAG